MSYQFIGTAEWTKQSLGRINYKDRVKITRQAFLPSLIKVVKSQLSIGKGVELKLEQILLPDTSAVISAIDELHSSAKAAIINHSMRTYFWGAALGIINNVEYDPEFLAVGCILHDLGTTEKYHGKHENCQCFAVDGALAAEAWAKSFGWAKQKQVLLGEMINLHMNGVVDVSNGNEAHLLQVGAACDLVGANFYDMSPGYRNAILQKYPRHKLNTFFNEFLEKESKIRPASRTSLLRSLGMPLMIKMNPYDE